MSKSQRAGDLVLKAIQCTKSGNLREAVSQFEEAIECIKYAVEYENFGSTGLYILKQRLKQYKKHVAKLRLKLPAEQPQDPDDDSQPVVTNTTASVYSHSVTTHDVMTTATDEPDSGHVTTEGVSNGRGPVYYIPDSTLGEDLFRPIPGEADYKDLKTAINFAKKAAQADQENLIAEALDLYIKAIEFFDLSTNAELTSDAGRNHVGPQVEYCRTRVAALSPVVHRDPAGYPIDEDVTPEDVTPDGDPEGAFLNYVTDQATLQRRPVAKSEVVGLDVVRAILLNAAIGGTTSFQRILLVGPSGTGKTSLVDSLFKDTSECFYVYQDGSILDPLNGAGDESITELFEDARQHKPSVIFLDKIDFLFPNKRLSRGCNGNLHQSTKQQLLEQLKDSNGRNEKIIFISATDSPWYIGPDIRDRFDHVVYASLPNMEERIAIAKLHAYNLLHTLSEEDFVTIAHKTEGFTGADIENTMRNAVISTVMELHKATHFKEVQFEDSTCPAAWTPCSPDDPHAVPMLWSEKIQIHPPEVTMKHVLDSLGEQVSSVTSSEEYRLRNWVFLSGKAPPEQIPFLEQRPDMNHSPPDPYNCSPTTSQEDAAVLEIVAASALASSTMLADDDVSDISLLSRTMLDIATQTDTCVISGMENSSKAIPVGVSLPPQTQQESDTDTLSSQSDLMPEMATVQATATGTTTCYIINVQNQDVKGSSHPSEVVEQPSRYTVDQYLSTMAPHEDSDKIYDASTFSIHTPPPEYLNDPPEVENAVHITAVNLERHNIGHLTSGVSSGEEGIIQPTSQEELEVVEIKMWEEVQKVESLEEDPEQSHAPAPPAGPERSPPWKKSQGEESSQPVPSNKEVEETSRVSGIQTHVSTPIVEQHMARKPAVAFPASQETPTKPELCEKAFSIPDAGEDVGAASTHEANITMEQPELEVDDTSDDAVYVVADRATWNSLNQKVAEKISEYPMEEEIAGHDSAGIIHEDVNTDHPGHAVLLAQPEGAPADMNNSSKVQEDSEEWRSDRAELATVLVASKQQEKQPVAPEQLLEEPNQVYAHDKIAQLASGVSTGLVWDLSTTMEENKKRNAENDNKVVTLVEEEGEPTPKPQTGAECQTQESLVTINQ